jgi:hypothetical protein
MRSVTKPFAVAFAFLLVAASTASAQAQLSIRGGSVTLVATNVTVRQILTEWARVGKTSIINVERIPGGPVTLQLTNVPESEALDILLRSVTGYMAVLRPVPLADLSQYDRILVLPTAAVARVPSAAAEPTPILHQPKGPRQPFSGDYDDGPSIVPPPGGPLFPTQPRAGTEGQRDDTGENEALVTAGIGVPQPLAPEAVPVIGSPGQRMMRPPVQPGPIIQHPTQPEPSLDN